MSGTSSSASAGRAPLTYSSYLRLEGLLSQQAPLTASHDEPLFIVIHQASELWLKLSLHELRAVRTCISQGDVRPALKMLARVAGIQKRFRTATGTCTSSARNLSTWKIVSNSGAMRTCARSSGSSAVAAARVARPACLISPA